MKNFFNNLRYDFPASIVVFFVALPLCLGIALASGVPLIAGIISGVIGGVIVGFFSGSCLGVSGPAAGLVVVVLGYVASLGSWENFLMAVVVAGIIQIIMGMLKFGSIAYYFPSSVIKGMLVGIGIIIIIKQIPHAIGYNPEIVTDFEEFLNQDNLTNIKQILLTLTPSAIIITTISMTILLSCEMFFNKKFKFFKFLQAPVLVVLAGIFIGRYLEFSTTQIVQLPIISSFSGFISQLSFPNFEMLRDVHTYQAAFVIAVIASLETLLCVEATDKIDPLKRITPTNRELKAQGLGNLISGLIGGLPITQVIVRSSANISFNARTKTSAILHGIFLMLSVITIPNLLNMIPLSSLASILIFVGYKLSNPRIFYNVYKLGIQQFLPFIITIFGVVYFDLLKGVGLGMIFSILFILYHNFKNSFEQNKDKELKDGSHYIKLSEEMSFLNKGAIIQVLNSIPSDSSVTIDATSTKIIDHDIVEIISDFRINAKSRNINLIVKGLI